MKNIFRIYKRDIKTMFTNWAAAIMMLVIILIPSMYSLINIKAAWDPYSNTKGMKIAVVNNDKGYLFNEHEINLGDEFVEDLKNDDKLGWQFVDQETAKNGLLMEEYYATLEIPESFSQDVTTFTTKDVKNPKLIYTVNEKKNSIAPKITDSGVESVKNELDDKIVKTISGVLLRVYNETGFYLDRKRPDLRKIVDGIYELKEQMPQLQKIVNDTIDGGSDVKSVLNKSNDIIPKISEVIESTDDFVKNSEDIIEDTEKELSNLDPIIQDNLKISENLLDNLSTKLNNIKDSTPEVAKNGLVEILDISEAGKTSLELTSDKLGSIRKFIKKIYNYEIPELNIAEDSELGQKIKEQRKLLKNVKDNLKEVNNSINDFTEKLDESSEKLDILNQRLDEKIKDLEDGEGLDMPLIASSIQTVDEIHKLTSDTLDIYNNSIRYSVQKGFDYSKNTIDSLLQVLEEAKNTLPNLEDTVNTSLEKTDEVQDKLINLKDKLEESSESLNKVSDKFKELDEGGRFNEILELITNDWNNQSDFLASAVKVEQYSLYPYPNYGSASTPFYTILCLWVGALIGTALLSVEAEELEEGVKLKSYEVYLGKLLTFLTLSICEALVASIGAVVFLKTHTVHPVMFIFYSIFVSIVFTVVIYTAASLLDDAGKAIIVFILVIQLAGSGGTFPIEVTPDFFQAIHRYLPFTYAINGMRQIMAGIVYEILIKDVVYLTSLMVIALTMGLLLKKPFNKGAEVVMKKLYAAGILRH